MTIDFWLLDLNFEHYQGKPTIWLWGITRQKTRVLLIDSYEPYFYLLPPSRQNIEQLKQQLDMGKPHSSISRTVIETKKDLSAEKQVVKVFCNDSESLEKCARATSKSVEESKAYEHDLRPATKYQNDHEIRPCQWYRVEADQADLDPSQYSVDKALIATSHPAPTTTKDPPALRTLGFSLLSISEAGSPSPARDPIRLIAWRCNDGKHGLLEAAAGSDEKILGSFGQIVTGYNPDVMFTFGGNTQHWPYLTRRAEKTRKTLAIGRGNVPPHQSLYGHFSITGRANIDLADFAEDLYDVKEKTRGNVAKYLGLTSDMAPIDETEYYTYWTKPGDRPKLVTSIGAEAETIFELGNDATPLRFTALLALGSSARPSPRRSRRFQGGQLHDDGGQEAGTAHTASNRTARHSLQRSNRARTRARPLRKRLSLRLHVNVSKLDDQVQHISRHAHC